MPTWAGGKQESGLANVIYNLAVSMSYCEEIDMTLAATDFFEPQKNVGNLKILGWNKKSLIIYAILHPFFTFYLLIHLLLCKKKYKMFVNVANMLVKGLFLNKTVHEIKPDIIHLHSAHSIVYLAAIPRKTRVVLTHHGIVGYDSHIPNSEVYAKIENDTCHTSRLSKLYFISNKLIDSFIKQYGAIDIPYEVILNAYDNTKFYHIDHIPQDKLTLVTIASFSENKGQERVVEAISRSKLDCRYICIGAADTDILNRIQNKAKSLHVDFEYLGKKNPSDIRRILATVDYMILPSSTEGFGLVYLEAIACGVPVILPSHLPIVQEKNLILPNINSLLIEDFTIESIVKVLSNLHKNKFSPSNVSKSITEFTWGNVGKKYSKSLLSLSNAN